MLAVRLLGQTATRHDLAMSVLRPYEDAKSDRLREATRVAMQTIAARKRTSVPR